MTGFGRASLACGSLTLNAEVSSVNQRGLAVTVHLPPEWSGLEARLAALPRETFQRGKVTLRLAVAGGGPADLTEPLRQLRELAARHGIAGQPDWHVLLKLVEQHRGGPVAPGADDALSSAAERCVREALAACDAMRLTEGAALARDLGQRLDRIGELAGRMARAEEGAVARRRDRLLRRLADLGIGVDLADERVLKELALQADRCDITEEITRLRSHLAQGGDLLQQAGSGRGLDFLTQELLREVNTVGSKAAEVDTTRLVVAAKTEIERFREQVQNLE